MRADQICIASADDHAGAPINRYRDYLPKWLHPDFDEYCAHHVSRFSTTQREASFFGPDWNSKFWETEGYDPELGTSVAWDATLRLKAMDESMIACSVLFPDDTNSNDPPWGAGLASAFQVGGSTVAGDFPPGLIRAGARAFNRWLADHCSADSRRLKGLIALGTSEDIVWCVEEIHRAHHSGLTAGVLLPLEHDQPFFHHPRYDMIWQACTELNLPVVSHIGRGHPSYVGEDPFVQFFFYGQDLMLYAQRPVTSLIIGGVLERFPTLRLVVTETGVDWVSPLLHSMETRFDRPMTMQADRDLPGRVHYSLRPTEYWIRQCSVTHSVYQKREQFEGEAYDSVPNMLFGADMCHFEGMWPAYGYPDPKPKGITEVAAALPFMSTAESFKVIFGGLPAANIVPYLQDNFFATYQAFDLEELREVAARIGPTASEVGLV